MGATMVHPPMVLHFHIHSFLFPGSDIKFLFFLLKMTFWDPCSVKAGRGSGGPAVGSSCGGCAVSGAALEPVLDTEVSVFVVFPLGEVTVLSSVQVS